MLALLRQYSISIFFGKITKIAHKHLNIAKTFMLFVCSCWARRFEASGVFFFNTNTNNDPISNSGLLILFLLL